MKSIFYYIAIPAFSVITITFGIVSATNIDPIPSIDNTFAIDGESIEAEDINKLAESINILDLRTSNFKEKIIVDEFGRVGIGTDSPSEKIDVDGNVKATFFIGDGSQLTNLPIFSGVLSGTQDLNGDSTAGDYGIKLTTKADGSTARDAGTEFVVTDGGSIGIGTSNPRSDAGITINDLGNNYSRLQFRINDSNIAGIYIDRNFSTLYHNDANGNIRFDIGDTEKLRLTSDGNVGIGTDSPEGKLHIRDSGRAVINIDSEKDSGGVARIKFNAKSNSLVPDPDEAYGIIDLRVEDSTDGSETSSITFTTLNSGNNSDTLSLYGDRVGIGNTNPNASLQIDSNHSIPLLKLTGEGSPDGDAEPFYGLHVTGQSPNNATEMYGGFIDVRPALAVDPSYGLYAQTKVWSAPGYGLYGKSVHQDVNGLGTAYGVYGTADAIDGVADNGQTYAGYFNNISKYGEKAVGLYVNADTGSLETILFQVASDGNEKMRVTAGGNVGIGTDNPTEKLDVAGNIKSSSLTGTYTNGSAYVCVNNSGVIYASETDCP